MSRHQIHRYVLLPLFARKRQCGHTLRRRAGDHGKRYPGLRRRRGRGICRERTGPLPTRIRPTGMGRRSPRNYRTESRHRGIGQVGRHDSRRFKIFRGGNFLFRPQREKRSPRKRIPVLAFARTSCSKRSRILLLEQKYGITP